MLYVFEWADTTLQLYKLHFSRPLHILFPLHKTPQVQNSPPPREYSHWMPKLSASVKYSLASPDHCLVILPTCWVPSAESTWGRVGGNVHHNYSANRTTHACASKGIYTCSLTPRLHFPALFAHICTSCAKNNNWEVESGNEARVYMSIDLE